jgi:soluble lytic murein transglycosylase-like protein
MTPEGAARDARLWKAAEDLEGLFVTQLLRATNVAARGFGGAGAGASVYRGIAEEVLGEALAESADWGVARELYRSLGRAAEGARPEGAPARDTGLAPEAPRGARRAADRTGGPAGADALGHAKPAPAARTDSPAHATHADAAAARHDEHASGASAPFSHVIAEASAVHGVDPRLVAAVMAQESAGDPRAVSPKGAMGLMQLIPSTARELGVENPFDPRENIFAGTRYLARMLDRFGGDVSLALAAYNAGPGAVARHRGIPPYRETVRYVANILTKLERAGGVASSPQPAALRAKGSQP